MNLRTAGVLLLTVAALSPMLKAQDATLASATPMMLGASPASPAPCASVETPSNQPVTHEYVIGEGDVLKISVWKEPDVSLSRVTVRPDGMISIPLVGVMKVSGTAPSLLQEELTSSLSRYLSHPKVTVTVVEINSKSVYLTGEVEKPGAYPLIVPTGVLQAIVTAGGPTQFAHRKSLFILRSVDGKQQKIPVDYGKLLRGGIQNPMLLPGDTVVMP